ncbi:MAG: hypothetical protein ACOWWR_20225 [Eubacteriales bacterium]
MNDKEKREEIFKNYKESVKKAKFAPLTKNALNLGNPLHHQAEKEDLQIKENNKDFYLEYRIKKLEEKIKGLMLYSTIALVLSIISIIIMLYNM